MEQKILNAIENFDLLKDVKDVTVALSGGADSMCLLHALLKLKEKYNFNLFAAHLNHMIRGDEALRDEKFVRDVCKNLDVELFVERVDVPEYAKTNKISMELAARQVRYDFFERVAKGMVATAHTASDNIETVLLNLTRGTSLKGLCGIPPIRGRFIRPLIYCTRNDIETYCVNNNIRFVTDSTNLSDEYTRNNIRHNVVPVLKQINPAVEENIIKMCENLRDDYLALENTADSFLKQNCVNNTLSLQGICEFDKSVKRLILSKFVSELNYGIELNSYHLDKLLLLTENVGKICLPNNFSAISDKNSLRIEPNNFSQTYSFKVEIEKNISDYKKVNSLLLNNTIDCDKISGELVIRTRLPGDSIRLAGRGNTKTLKKLYNECKIPLDMRDTLPVIADDLGVVWIYGIGIADRCAVRENSKNICFIKAEQGKINE